MSDWQTVIGWTDPEGKDHRIEILPHQGANDRIRWQYRPEDSGQWRLVWGVASDGRPVVNDPFTAFGSF